MKRAPEGEDARSAGPVVTVVSRLPRRRRRLVFPALGLPLLLVFAAAVRRSEIVVNKLHLDARLLQWISSPIVVKPSPATSAAQPPGAGSPARMGRSAVKPFVAEYRSRKREAAEPRGGDVEEPVEPNPTPSRESQILMAASPEPPSRPLGERPSIELKPAMLPATEALPTASEGEEGQHHSAARPVIESQPEQPVAATPTPPISCRKSSVEQSLRPSRLTAAAPEYCPEELLHGSARSPQAYKFRDGNRCEGEYAQHVSACGLNLRSLTRALDDFDPAKGTDLAWSVPPDADSAVRIMALSLRPRLYYRMDTAVPKDQGCFPWPGDIVESFELTGEEIGIRAWVSLPGPGATRRDVFLPVGIGKGSSLGSKDGYQICLWPDTSLKEIRQSIAQTDERGNITKWLRKDEEVDLDFIPSDQAACFATGPLGLPGYYRLRFAAITNRGDRIVEEYDFYHP